MIWNYKIINKHGDLETGNWETSMTASAVCRYFEDTKAEIIAITKVEEEKVQFAHYDPLSKEYYFEPSNYYNKKGVCLSSC